MSKQTYYTDGKRMTTLIKHLLIAKLVDIPGKLSHVSLVEELIIGCERLLELPVMVEKQTTKGGRFVIFCKLQNNQVVN